MNLKNMPATSSAWYALRRTLPTWSFQQNLQEIIEHATACGIDEVIVKFDTEEFHHGHGILDLLQAYEPRLIEMRDALAAIGVAYSVNPWVSIGHNDRGRDSRAQLPGLQTVVNAQGHAATNRACPLCPVWRENVKKLWTIYARTQPRVLWIEDDIKFHLGGGCYCPHHMAMFSERVGQAVTREQLVAAVNAPGTPHPWREVYFHLLDDVILETVDMLRETVQAQSPETSMGLMSSGPRNHCRSGRRWPQLAAVLGKGGQPVFSRPPLGSYHEGSLRALYHTQDSIRITRHCMGPAAVELTEVENVPFSRYSKSATFTFLQMAVSIACGARGVTLNLFDHMGRPMQATPEFGRMLGEAKNYLNALAERAQGPGVFRGIQLLHRDDSALHRHLESDKPFAFTEEGFRWVELLESCGIPTTYDDADVVALDGQLPRALTDGQIHALLGKALILDSVAAGILHERGFGALIGLQGVDPLRELATIPMMAAEQLVHPDFGGRPDCFMTLLIPNLGASGKVATLHPHKDALVVSQLIDADRQTIACGSYAFTNALGGRVYVLAHELASCHGTGAGMLSPERAALLQSVQRWLGQGEAAVRLEVDGVYPWLLRRDHDHQTLVGAFNLSLDPWPSATFVLHDKRQLASVQRLDGDGVWREHHAAACDHPRQCVRITHDAPVTLDRPVFFAVRWKT